MNVPVQQGLNNVEMALVRCDIEAVTPLTPRGSLLLIVELNHLHIIVITSFCKDLSH